MKRAFLLLGVVVALTSSVAGTAVHAAEAAPAATERLPALDQEILARLNAFRTARGLRPLVVSASLEDAAVAHSRTMLERGFFAHDTPGGAPFVARVRSFYRSAGYQTWSIGENLLYSSAEVTAKGAIDAWIASPSHRENMLSPGWREVGVGSLHAAAAGGAFAGEPTWVITMDFGARSGKTTSATAKKPTTRATASARKAPPRKHGSHTKTPVRVLPGPTSSTGGGTSTTAPASSPSVPVVNGADSMGMGRHGGEDAAADSAAAPAA